MNIILIAALTADGFIGRTSGHTADWTSKEDKQLFVKVTKQAGTIVMGSKALQSIGRALPERRMIVLTSRPADYDVENVEFTAESPTGLVSRLVTEGVTELAVCGGAQVYRAFMNADLVGELYLTVEPVLFGTGVTLFAGELETNLQLKQTQKLNEN